MNKDKLLNKIMPSDVDVTPNGVISLELSNEKLSEMADVFFEKILKIREADISGIEGFGEFDETGSLPYETSHDLITGTFSEKNEGYWMNWKMMYDTTSLDEEFFNEYYEKMVKLSPFIIGKRFLVNNNTFFDYMITDGKSHIGFPDWNRAGIMDFLIDIAIMDLEKPYLLLPEKFYSYINKNHIQVENFKERFLCMAYFKGLDTLRWHASIDDVVSVESIMKSMSELENRIMSL